MRVLDLKAILAPRALSGERLGAKPLPLQRPLCGPLALCGFSGCFKLPDALGWALTRHDQRRSPGILPAKETAPKTFGPLGL
jgi:hypothetical protein